MVDTIVFVKLKRKTLFSLTAVGLIFIAGILVFIMGHIQIKAEVVIEADPASEVYLDGERLGVTPQTFQTIKMKPTIKIVPTSKVEGYLPYETELSLTPHTKTIVRRNFSKSITETTMQILSFVKTQENASPMTIITNPGSAYIFINNEYVGTSPLRVDRPVDTYSVQVMHTGYQAMHLSLKNSSGFNLTAFLDLAKQNATPTVKNNTNLGTVTILKTPTGYVRVHDAPTESGSEIARALEGREYVFKSYSPLKTWIELELNASESGWIVSKYATVSGQIKSQE